MRAVKHLRNVGIIMALALLVAFAPGGGNGAETVLTALSMGFLAAIAWYAYDLRRRNELTFTALSEGRRAILYGALGLICLLIAGTDEFFASGGGTLAWIALLGGSAAAIWWVWQQASSY